MFSDMITSLIRKYETELKAIDDSIQKKEEKGKAPAWLLRGDALRLQKTITDLYILLTSVQTLEWSKEVDEHVTD